MPAKGQTCRSWRGWRGEHAGGGEERKVALWTRTSTWSG